MNWRRVWPLIDLATGITGLALLIVGDLGGNRPLRALGVVLIGIAVMAVVAHLCSRTRSSSNLWGSAGSAATNSGAP